jgi:putative ABC transport system permease protein
MPPLARRNLLYDRVRLAVTLTGIVFAVVLIVVEAGLFLGFTVTTSNIIDNSGVDLWVASKGVPYIELGVPFSERKLYQVKAVPGVQDAEKFILRWTQWKRADGRTESVQIVGLNPDKPLGGPWNLVEGAIADLKKPDAIIIDEVYKKKLGVERTGQVFEINGRRARIVGFTRGIRAFTTAPHV